MGRRDDLLERRVLLRMVGAITGEGNCRNWNVWLKLRLKYHPRTLTDDMRMFPTDALIESAAYAWSTGPRPPKHKRSR